MDYNTFKEFLIQPSKADTACQLMAGDAIFLLFKDAQASSDDPCNCECAGEFLQGVPQHNLPCHQPGRCEISSHALDGCAHLSESHTFVEDRCMSCMLRWNSYDYEPEQALPQVGIAQACPQPYAIGELLTEVLNRRN